jgi:hypothetical protein
MNIAHELGYSLAKLMREMTLEEVILWSAFYDLRNEEQDRRIKRQR